MNADFLAEAQGLSTEALEDQLRCWESFASIAKLRSQELRDELRARYEQEEVSYFFTDYGLVRGHDKGSPNGRFQTDR